MNTLCFFAREIVHGRLQMTATLAIYVKPIYARNQALHSQLFKAFNQTVDVT